MKLSSDPAQRVVRRILNANKSTIMKVAHRFVELFGSVEIPDSTGFLFSDLTTYEVESAITQSIVLTKKERVNPKRIDPDFIRGFRAERLKLRGVNF